MSMQFNGLRPVLNLPLLALAVLSLSMSGLPAIAAITTSYTFVDLYAMEIPSGYNGVIPGKQPITTTGSAVGSASTTPVGSKPHALLWNGTDSPIDLHPTGFEGSIANGVKGLQLVGNAYGPPISGATHAMLWNGSNAPIDLNPTGFTSSDAWSTDGVQQVGNGHPVTAGNLETHALVWNSTSAAIDLHPALFDWSIAYAVSAGRQVGYGVKGGQVRALFWDTNHLPIDLQPPGFTFSQAFALGGAVQVGSGSGPATGNKGHALLWQFSNAATDLHPAGFTDSAIYGTNGIQHVGSGGTTSTGIHALLWNGASSTVDLGALLPVSFLNSEAYTLDPAGNVFGLAYDNTGVPHAVEWVANVPEPGCLSLLVIGAMCLRWRHTVQRDRG